MIFLILTIISDTFRFSNPKVIEIRDSIYSTEVENSQNDSLNFEGSKGFYASIDGLSLSFSQSLDVMVSGKLSDKYTLSARLRDSDVAYGDDYYSKALKDVDEIFFTLRGTDGLEVDIGKIVANLRKITGFSFGYKGFRGSYGTTDQKFRRKELQVQTLYKGPYFVDSGYDLVPGSVRLFVNGQPVSKDFYYVDYSTGVLYFDGSYLPDPGDAVYVEYSLYSVMPAIYSDAHYKAKYFSVDFERYTLRRELFNGFPSELLELLAIRGDSAGTHPYYGGFESAEGDYIFQDSFFVYAGPGLGSHKVYFKYIGNGQGSYIFDNTIGGYRYVGQGNGYYEPLIDINSPVDIIVSGFRYQGLIDAGIQLSFRDLNTLSTRDDNDNFGYQLEVGRKMGLNLFSLALKAKYRSNNFGMIEPEIDADWGTERSSKYGQLDAEVGTQKIPATFKFSYRNYSGKNSFLVKGCSRPGPFMIGFNLQREDTLSFEGVAGWNSLKFPDARIVILRTDKPARVMLYDDLPYLEYRTGIVWSKSRARLYPFLTINLKGEFKDSYARASVSYFPEYWNFLIYNLSASFNVFQGITFKGNSSLGPVYKSLREERYYSSPSGDYSYDERTGLFVPSENGNFVRDIFSLGVIDTAAQKEYSVGFDLDLYIRGSLVAYGISSRVENVSGFEIYLYRSRFQLQASGRSVTDRLVINARIKRDHKYFVVVPFSAFLSSRLGVENYFEEPFSYSVRKLTFVFEKMKLNLEGGFSYTYFEELKIPGLFLNILGRTYKGNLESSWNIFASYPISDSRSLPYLVPTSRRVGANLIVKRKTGNGAYFAELHYLKSDVTVQKAKVGYQFLF